MLYTGLDLHKSFSYITTMNDKGEVIGQKKLPSNGEILNFLSKLLLTNQRRGATILCCGT